MGYCIELNKEYIKVWLTPQKKMEGRYASGDNTFLKLYHKKSAHITRFSTMGIAALKKMNVWIEVLMKVTMTVSLHEILEKIPPGKPSVFYGMQKQWDWTKHHEQTVKQ